MKSWMVWALALLAVACGDKDAASDGDAAEDSGDGGPGVGASTGGDEGPPVGPEPVIQEADAWCYTPGGSVEGDFWGLKAICGPSRMNPFMHRSLVKIFRMLALQTE